MGNIRPMQLLTNVSKYFIVAVLVASLLVTRECTNVVITEFGSASATSETSSMKQADSIWDSMRSDLKLDHQAQSARVQAEIRKLLADQDDLNRILKAAQPYIYYIYSQTQRRGLPAELALIPVIESEYNPNDHSKKGATGLWQLMPATATELGVKVKSGYDGRRNVVASTKAALAYFNDLGNMFKGNWYLAIAAYNCGQVRIANAMHRTGSNSYWNLPLPQETKLYVPKLLAVAEIIKNPEKYGVQLPEINDKPYFAELKLTKSVNLSNVAQSSGINIETLHTLNPDYNHPVVPSNGTYTLLVPANKAPAVKAKLADKIVEVASPKAAPISHAV